MVTQSLLRRRLLEHRAGARGKGWLFSKNLSRLFASMLAPAFIVILAFFATARTQGLQGEEAQQSASMSGLDVGKLLYQYNCASCHGESLAGEGPVAKVLKTPPSNLTLLAKHNGGKFPRAEVYGYVVGTKTVVAHGTREMPVWSSDLYAVPKGPYGLSEGPLTRAERIQRVNEIVDYIATKQVK